MVAVVAESLGEIPGPQAGITVTQLGVGDSVVTVWRLADDQRHPIPGQRRVHMNDAGFVTDYYVPTNRPVVYEVEVLSGPNGPARASSAPLTVVSGSGWLMDPLVPQSAIPVVGERRSDGDIYLRSQALSSLEYGANVSMFQIIGSDKPIALFGQRMAETGMDISVSTRSAEQNSRLKALLRSTASLHFRPLLEWGPVDIEGSMFLASAMVRQTPVNVMFGGKLTWWDLPTDTVQAPTIKVLTASFTYGDVALLMASYGQKQDLMGGKSYLDDLKNPLGG